MSVKTTVLAIITGLVLLAAPVFATAHHRDGEPAVPAYNCHNLYHVSEVMSR